MKPYPMAGFRVLAANDRVALIGEIVVAAASESTRGS
jgi:hypothetical protein